MEVCTRRRYFRKCFYNLLAIFTLIIFVNANEVVAETQIPASELQSQLAQYQEQQQAVKKAASFDANQGLGAQYHYPFFTATMVASSSWLASGNTKIEAYNSKGILVGSIDLSNIISNGQIDILSYTGLNGHLKTSGEFAITYGNDWELSYFNLSGGATAHNEILTHPSGGTMKAYIASTLTSDLNMEVFSLQKSWDVASIDPLSFQLLLGAKAVFFRYDYMLQTAAPTSIIKASYNGRVANSFPPWIMPYFGVGYRLNLGDFYISNSFAGMPGKLDDWIRGEDDAYFQMYFRL